MFVTTSGGGAQIFPYVQVFDLPYLMRDDRVAEAVLTDGGLTKLLRDKALEDSGGTIRIMTDRQHRRLAQLRQHAEAGGDAPRTSRA